MDDDCDAASADGSEDPGVGVACDGADSDLCQEGTTQCSGGAITCSDTTGGTVDLCNGLDDDCDAASADGSEDTGIGAACDGADSDLCQEGTTSCSGGVIVCSDSTGNDIEGPAGEATCSDGVDNDCDGSTDEGLTRGTTCVIGACAGTGAETCSAGTWGNNTCTPGTPQTEGPYGNATCSDASDNDCDGLTDGADPNCAALNLPDLTGQWTSMRVRHVRTTQWFAYGNLKVTNQGNADAGPFVIKFYYIPSGGGSPQYLRERSRLGRRMGRTTNVTFRHMFSSNPSGGSILAVIDANNAVAESNETNNEATRNIP